MSKKGIKLAASVFSNMQETRGRLLEMSVKGEVDKQDLLLAQMLEKGKEAMKDDFAYITDSKYPGGRTTIN